MTKPPFTPEELAAGESNYLRAVQTPKPGETVEVGYIITDLVLCLNRAVREIENLQEQIRTMGQEVRFKESEPFQLPSVAGDYEQG